MYEKPLLTGHSLPQKRGAAVGKTKRGKGTKIMAIADAHGLPIAGIVGSTSPHEVTYVKETIHNCFIEQNRIL